MVHYIATTTNFSAIGSTVWELEGPMPILNKSNVLMDISILYLTSTDRPEFTMLKIRLDREGGLQHHF